MLLSERARGRWREILPALGIAAQFLRNKGGPCPMCGGKDRFRWDNKNEEGTWYCNQCGAGNGWTLVRRFNKWTKEATHEEIERIIGKEHHPAAPVVHIEKPGAQRLVAIERLLEQCRAPLVVNDYLASRGLTVTSDVLRGHKLLGYYEEIDDRLRKTGDYPAVVAPILGPDGSLQSAHRIYWAKIDNRKKTMPAVDNINGGAVRLFEPTDELAIGEGIETCLAVREMYGFPIWSGLTAGGVEKFEWPPSIRKLWIFGDNDSSFTGQTAAYALAKRARLKKLEAQVYLPPVVDQDWLDYFNSQPKRDKPVPSDELDMV